MDLDLSDDQEQLVSAFRAFLAKECPSEVVRAAEPLGFDPVLWQKFGDLGGSLMGVDEDRGGAGASLLDLVLVAEVFGEALAPIPFVESTVCARGLAASGSSVTDALARLDDPTRMIGTVALRPVVGDAAPLVPAGQVAGMLYGLHDDCLVVVESPPPAAEAHRGNLGSMPVAHRRLDETSRAVLLDGPAARDSYARALNEWRILTAASLVGLATRALDLGVAYARDRHQFGVPIGSFQSISHSLADAATAVDGSRLLVREAAWAAESAPHKFDALANMAFLFAAQTAQLASGTSLHVHGGYGFMSEYDIQLYFRRAKAWPLVMGDPRRGVGVLADALFGPAGEA
jgi:alkylation response protein AidB-like acyl-CoA dehydrogenase